MFYGMIHCSKCFKEYKGADVKDNLCPACHKKLSVKLKRLKDRLYKKFSSSPAKDKILFNYLYDDNNKKSFKEYIEHILDK